MRLKLPEPQVLCSLPTYGKPIIPLLNRETVAPRILHDSILHYTSEQFLSTKIDLNQFGAVVNFFKKPLFSIFSAKGNLKYKSCDLKHFRTGNFHHMFEYFILEMHPIREKIWFN